MVDGIPSARFYRFYRFDHLPGGFLLLPTNAVIGSVSRLQIHAASAALVR